MNSSEGNFSIKGIIRIKFNILGVLNKVLESNFIYIKEAIFCIFFITSQQNISVNM